MNRAKLCSDLTPKNPPLSLIVNQQFSERGKMKRTVKVFQFYMRDWTSILLNLPWNESKGIKMEETTSREDWRTRFNKCVHSSKMESGWQAATILGFIFLHSAKCFSILQAGRNPNKKKASSHQRTLKRLKNWGDQMYLVARHAELKQKDASKFAGGTRPPRPLSRTV